MPENARWSVIAGAAHTPEIGTIIDEATERHSVTKTNEWRNLYIMKINKITLLVCSILTVVSGLTMVVIESTVPDNIDASLCQSVVSGIFTGFIVSLVISVIGYFHERNIILEKTDSNIKSLYINMMVLSKIIGSVLPQIHKAASMESLPFKNISGLSELNVSFTEKMDLGLFSPLWKWGRLAHIYTELIEFQRVLYNIKNISVNLQAQTMEFTIKTLEIQNAQLQGAQLSPTVFENVNELRNLINIRTAKLHEYVTGQTLELENIAKSFYSYKNRKCPWEMIKANLMVQVEDIVKR